MHRFRSIAILVCTFCVVHSSLQASDPITLDKSAKLATGANDVVTQNDPPEQNGKINATVTRSIENETVTLRAIFPSDADRLKVSLHNLLGREIEVHPRSSSGAGEETFTFDTRDLPNGPYFIVLEALGQRITKKIMVPR